MQKEESFKGKLIYLKSWLPLILDSIKKDLKNDHLKQDFTFVKLFLNGKNYQKVDLEELNLAYFKALNELDTGEKIGEFIANRWIFRHSDMYHYFEQALSKLNPDFTAISEIKEDEALKIIENSVKEYGAPNTYIFSVLNSVAFSKAQFDQLSKSAEEASKNAKELNVIESDRKNKEDLIFTHQQEMTRLTDKYEKKLLGMQKKYTTDVEVLKKQVSVLQKKIAANV